MPAKSKAPAAKSPIDWAAVRAQIENANAPARSDPAAAANKIAEILLQRAQVLARPLGQDASPADLLEVVAFELGGQTFALEAITVREAVLPRDLTRLPGLASHVRGVVNVRSRVVPALDLRPLLQLPPATATAEEKLLIVTHEGADFGIFVDRLLGLRGIALASVRREVPGLSDKYLRGIADGLVLLDLPALFPDLVVRDTAEF